MGVTMYWLVLVAVIVLGLVMPQHGRKRIYYIVLVAAIHAFVSGFRYEHLTGDLMKYQWNFVDYLNHDYFSEHLLNDGINTVGEAAQLSPLSAVQIHKYSPLISSNILPK